MKSNKYGIFSNIKKFVISNKNLYSKKVILCGASTKMVKLQALIKQKFNDSKILNYQSPDEILSLGCAKQCSLITNSKMKKINKEDLSFKCLSNSINLKVNFFELKKISIFSSKSNYLDRKQF